MCVFPAHRGKSNQILDIWPHKEGGLPLHWSLLLWEIFQKFDHIVPAMDTC